MNDDTPVVEKRSGYLWITLPDAVSMYNSKAVEQAVLSQITDTKSVVLDLSKTNNIFSAGLGLFIKIRKHVFEKSGTVCLVNVSAKHSELFTSLKLDKVFPIFSTDVEFEIYQNDVWQQKCAEKQSGFILVSQIEKKIYHIHLSGQMTCDNDLTPCDVFRPQAGIGLYLINLSNLELIDMQGAIAFRELTFRISGGGGICRGFGASEKIHDTICLLGADGYTSFYNDEQSAFNGNNPIIS
ncbi:MAG: STAS domain-containing protein [Chitinispirillaceae bacterium]|nr:STAS domain-containing protein [Chitinispirillaceae bacterium]